MRFLQISLCLCLSACLGGGGSARGQESQERSHAQIIRSWNDTSFERGRALYEALCITCHGTPEREGTLPTSRPFWQEPFKNGADPHSIYKTLTKGLGQMPAWTFLTPEQRYDAIQYIREEFIRPHNPDAYFAVTERYLAGLPDETFSPLEASIAAIEQEPPYLRMDFGPALFWTIEAAPGNIAYKGIAIRLDDGPGGISKGRVWMLYDHDTLRVAAAWTGDRFIDWRGIAFDGSHGTHARIVGESAFVNPVGPGWADPATGQFDDPRPRGRDHKPYGPLPREWARYKGAYFHENRVIMEYTVGETTIREMPGLESGAFSRTLNIGATTAELAMRIAPSDIPATIVGQSPGSILETNGFNFLIVPKQSGPARIKLLIGTPDSSNLATIAAASEPPLDLSTLCKGGTSRWNPPLATQGSIGGDHGPFATDLLAAPPDAANPWRTWMRFGGFDFFSDGDRAAICTWNGDVWIVTGIRDDLQQLTWKRIASGLFQPLGLKIVGETIHVACRDQIARLHDFNGDEEIDFIESFNNDHQVTEHFHEFAMGLQTDAEGNFYYAKSARHALPSLVPHHGTLLKVSPDGRHTTIVATGFRAANGVCVNDDGTFFVTDQEGHWTPKNRINWVRPGGFYGNIFGYHDGRSTADEEMEQPVVWITNEMDRSPGELVRIAGKQWGPLAGKLLNLSYGTGRIFLVNTETAGSRLQGSIVQLPLEDFPTGVMRGRIHPETGDLYLCGMYAWAGNKHADGGFYRVRRTSKPAWLPVSLRTRANHIDLAFSDALDPKSAASPASYRVRTWSLKRGEQYGSRHYNEQELSVTSAVVDQHAKTVSLEIPHLRPTQSIEIVADLRSPDGTPLKRTIHGTIHQLAEPATVSQQ